MTIKEAIKFLKKQDSSKLLSIVVTIDGKIESIEPISFHEETPEETSFLEKMKNVCKIKGV